MRISMEYAPRILLLTSGLGTGHTRAMAAVEEALLEQAPGATTCSVDFWTLINVEVAQAIQQTYLKLVTEHPDLYHRLYQLDQHSWRNILERGAPLPTLLRELRAFVVAPQESSLTRAERHWFDRLLFRQLLAILDRDPKLAADLPFRDFWQQAAVHRSWALLTRRLQRCIERFVPDVVVATQVNMAALASRLKAGGQLRVPLVGVITDYGVHDFWLQPCIDAFCVPEPSMRSPLQFSRSAVHVTGMPISTAFRELPPQADARARLGLPLQRSIVLLLGGGLGIGIDSTIRTLLAAQPRGDTTLFVVLAGRNDQLGRELQADATARAALANGALRIEGWTDRIPLFMRAADLVVGKPGGLSTAEVLAAGRPLLFTSSLGGQEAFNVGFLEAQGVGQLVEESQLAARVSGLLANRFALQSLQSQAAALGRRDGAECVAARVLELIPASLAGAAGGARQRAK